MALSYVGYASAVTTSATLPAYTVGDLAIVFAFRDGSNTPPSLPAGWTDKSSSGSASSSFRAGWRVLQSGDTTTGVWTNATEVQVLVLRGQNASQPIGTDTFVWNGNGTSITYQAPLTLNVGDGSSWVVGLAGHRTATDVLSRTVTGMTNRSSGGTATALSAHTEQVSSWPTNKSFTVNASSGWRSITFEVLVATTVKQTGTAEVSLAPAQTPDVRTSHRIVAKARKTNAAHAGVLRVQLFEGATARSAVLETAELTTDLLSYAFDIPQADAEDIVSYANLSVRVQGYSAAGTATVFEVAALELQLPAATTGASYGAVDMPVTFGASTAGQVISAGDKTTSPFEVSFAAANTPATRTAHQIVVRARKTNGAHTGTIRAQLYEGATPRSTELETANLSTTLSEYILSVSDADAATIGSYANLSVRIRGYASTGDATVFEVAQVSLLVPTSTESGVPTGAATLASYAVVSVGGGAGTPVYPGAAVFPHALATVSATVTIAAAPTLVGVFGAAVLASTATVVAGGAVPPTNITALMVLPSTVTITAAGATAGDAVGAALLATTAVLTVDSYQDITAAAALAATVTITAAGTVPVAPAPPGYLDTLPHMPDLLVAVAFDTPPLEPIQAYEAVTDWVRNTSTKRGRQFELDRTEAGTAHLLLDNRDSRFNPENTASPYYPNLKPTRRLQLRAAWDSVIYLLYTGFLEGYPMSYPNVGFDRVVNQDAVDVFMALALARFIPGSTTLTAELTTPDVHSDSSGTLQHYVWVESTALPMPQKVPFEITIDKDTQHAETMTVIERVRNNLWLAERDILKATGHTYGAIVTTEVVSFGEELTGTRISHVLERINLPIATSLDSGVALLAESDNLAGQSPLEHLQLAAETEGGRLFVATNGTLTFHSRHHFALNEPTDRATFGDAGGTELTYIDATPTHEDEKLFNIVRVIPASGNAQEVRDEASIADHFERVLEKQWPLADDNEALSAAEYLLSRLSRMQIRIPQMTLDGAADPDQLWPVILGLELGQRYRFKMRPRDGSQIIDKTLVVEGVSHTVEPASLRTAVQLSLADTGAYWQLGVAGKSELGTTTTLAY